MKSAPLRTTKRSFTTDVSWPTWRRYPFPRSRPCHLFSSGPSPPRSRASPRSQEPSPNSYSPPPPPSDRHGSDSDHEKVKVIKRAGPAFAHEDPTSQLAYEISVPALLTLTSSRSVELVPQSYYAGLRSDGISWLILTEFPRSSNLAAVQAAAASHRLRVAAKHPDGFTPDSDLASLLRAGDGAGFEAALLGMSSQERSRLLHAESPGHDCEIPMALLALPGLKVFRGDDRELRRIFGRNAFLNGTFSIPEVNRINGTVVAWKYTGETGRVLVCVNPTDQRGIAQIPCPEAPEPVAGDKIEVPELIMDSTFRRDPNVMRTTGLFVILHAGEVQIFEY